MIEIIDKTIPNIKAWSLAIFPVGIGLRHVLVIKLSRSASYHIFNAPAAPAPIVTKKIQIIESIKGIWLGEVNKPTAHVNITRDITLGFINRYKDLRKFPKSRIKIEAVLFLIVLDKINLRLLQQIL